MRRIALLLAATILAAPAQAAPLVAYYEASWASLPAAILTLRIDGESGRYVDTLHIETVGIPHWLIHLRGKIESTGAFAADGGAKPELYSVDYDLRRYKGQRIRMKYVPHADGLIGERTHDDSSNKPPLPEKYRVNTIDPMAAFAVIREKLRGRPVKIGDKYMLPIFDDVRRFDLSVAVVGVDAVTKQFHIHAELKAIAGFKDKHEDGGDPEDAPRPLEFYFRNDAQMLPTRFEVAVGWLPVIARLDKICDAGGNNCVAEDKPKK